MKDKRNTIYLYFLTLAILIRCKVERKNLSTIINPQYRE